MAIDTAKTQDLYCAMASRFPILTIALLFLAANAAFAQGPSVIVQPGAPGENSKVLTAATVHTGTPAPTQADTDFMQGMIHHHQQAVEMVALMPARTHNKALLKLGQRISISQTDEIKMMRTWLE